MMLITLDTWQFITFLLIAFIIGMVFCTIFFRPSRSAGYR